MTIDIDTSTVPIDIDTSPVAMTIDIDSPPTVPIDIHTSSPNTFRSAYIPL